ncbi:hypothetical protein MHYP_G00064960 [Metynnis hypsauchen]
MQGGLSHACGRPLSAPVALSGQGSPELCRHESRNGLRSLLSSHRRAFVPAWPLGDLAVGIRLDPLTDYPDSEWKGEMGRADETLSEDAGKL